MYGREGCEARNRQFTGALGKAGEESGGRVQWRVEEREREGVKTERENEEMKGFAGIPRPHDSRSVCRLVLIISFPLVSFQFFTALSFYGYLSLLLPGPLCVQAGIRNFPSLYPLPGTIFNDPLSFFPWLLFKDRYLFFLIQISLFSPSLSSPLQL